jgi:hypothetical protein
MVALEPCFHTVPAIGLVGEMAAREAWARARRARAAESLYIRTKMSGKRGKRQSWWNRSLLPWLSNPPFFLEIFACWGWTKYYIWKTAPIPSFQLLHKHVFQVPIDIMELGRSQIMSRQKKKRKREDCIKESKYEEVVRQWYKCRVERII